MDWGQAHTKKVQKLHHEAAKKHIGAMESAYKAGDGDSMRSHYYKASTHLGAARSAGKIYKENAAQHAKDQTNMAKHVSNIAYQHQTEQNSHSLDYGSRIHLLAAEQQDRAAEAHTHPGFIHYHQMQAKKHQARRRELKRMKREAAIGN